jgi:hypothetical protein
LFPTHSLPRLNIRLPAKVKAWVVEEAAARQCPMNTVVLDALKTKMTLVLSEQENKKHAAAIELAISVVARLPTGTATMLQNKHHQLRTDILVREPSQADYSVLARVNGEEVVFADDFVTPVAESGA